MTLSADAQIFADAHRVARLATADVSGRPHVVPFCYARIGGRFYFVIDEKPKRGSPLQLKRMRNIAQNPRVAFVIDDYNDDWTQLAYLLAHGSAAVVDAEVEYQQALALLRTRYEPYQRMPLAFQTHPIVRIEVEAVHFWRANAF